MINFHENKLWQDAYVALMDIHDVVDALQTGEHGEIINNLLTSAHHVTAVIADSLTRRDRRVAQELLNSAVGEVATTRTHLAVAWGRGLMDDDTFQKLDNKYADLSTSLQR